METLTIHVSNATMYGWGSDPWKGVSYVSDEDRATYMLAAQKPLTNLADAMIRPYPFGQVRRGSKSWD